jgi:flagellar protein FliS
MSWSTNPFANPHSAAQAYARVGVETGVASANALCLATARGHMLRHETPAKGAVLSHAIRILDEGLSASLNLDDGGGVALQLKELYAYMCRRIVVANLRNDALILDEVAGLLTDLRQAWATIDQSARTSPEGTK